MNRLISISMKKVWMALFTIGLLCDAASAKTQSDFSLASISVGQTYSDQPLTVSGIVTSVAPSGKLASISVDVLCNGQLTLDHVNWQSEQVSHLVATTSFDAKSTAITYSHYLENWTIRGNYTSWHSTQTQFFNQAVIAEQTHRMPSYAVATSYHYVAGDWHISPGITVQLNHYQNQKIDEERRLTLAQDEALLTSLLLQATYMKPISAERFLMFGSLLRVNQLFYGEAPKRRSGPQFSLSQQNGAERDELFSELSLFVTFDLNKNWSFELDSSVLLDNMSSHSVTWRLGYRF